MDGKIQEDIDNRFTHIEETVFWANAAIARD